jgi:hypothetical protein
VGGGGLSCVPRRSDGEPLAERTLPFRDTCVQRFLGAAHTVLPHPPQWALRAVLRIVDDHAIQALEENESRGGTPPVPAAPFAPLGDTTLQSPVDCLATLVPASAMSKATLSFNGVTVSLAGLIKEGGPSAHAYLLVRSPVGGVVVRRCRTVSVECVSLQ